MKTNQLIRSLLMLAAMVSSIILLESIRKNHRYYPAKKIEVSSGKSNPGNTDYIFFQSISKYFFTSFVN